MFTKRRIYKWHTSLINSSRSSAVFLISPLRECWISFAISFTVSWRNFAYSILAFSLLFKASYKLTIIIKTNNLLDNGTAKSEGYIHRHACIYLCICIWVSQNCGYPASMRTIDKWETQHRVIRWNICWYFK